MQAQSKFIKAAVVLIALVSIGMFINIRYFAKEHFLKNGGFSRIVAKHSLLLISKLTIPGGSTQYLGTFKNQLFLANYTTNDILILENKDSYKVERTVSIAHIQPKSIELDEKNGQLVVFSDNLRTMFVLNLSDFAIISRVRLPRGFLHASKLNNDILVVEGQDFKPIIKLYKLNKTEGVAFANNIYSFGGKSLDEDGLLKNNGKDRFVYLSFFKNTSLTIDTFGLVYHHKTIDTITTGPKSQVVKEGQYTYMQYAEPPRIANEDLQLLDSLSIVTSSVKSNNQKDEDNSLILDLYNRKGNYIKSITFDYKMVNAGKKPESAFLHGDIISFIFDNEILNYKTDSI